MTTRISFPELGQGEIDIESTIAGGSNHHRAKKFLLIGSTNTLDCRITDTDSASNAVSKFITRLQGILPAIDEVRVHLDVDFYVNVDLFDWKQFTGLLAWPKLKILTLEISKGCKGTKSCATEEQVTKLRELLQSMLEAETWKLGKVNVQVIASEEKEIVCPRVEYLNLREKNGRRARALEIRRDGLR